MSEVVNFRYESLFDLVCQLWGCRTAAASATGRQTKPTMGRPGPPANESRASRSPDPRKGPGERGAGRRRRPGSEGRSPSPRRARSSAPRRASTNPKNRQRGPQQRPAARRPRAPDARRACAAPPARARPPAQLPPPPGRRRWEAPSPAPRPLGGALGGAAHLSPGTPHGGRAGAGAEGRRKGAGGARGARGGSEGARRARDGHASCEELL